MNIAQLAKQVEDLQLIATRPAIDKNPVADAIADIDPLSVTLAVDVAVAVNEILAALRAARIIRS